MKPGSVNPTTICTTDFFATFAELVGKEGDIPDNAAEDSFSFLPCLKGAKKPIRPFTIHHSISGVFAIRKGHWKLILNKGAGGGWGGSWETTKTSAKAVQLYNMKNDPGETRNLEEVHPEVVKELVDDLAGAFRNGRTTPGTRQENEGWPYRDGAMQAKFPQLSEK
ncbi:MAG: hypothetical protein GY899_14250 [Verrucomicrobiaceae bacterium]|nr:hypothetical protein [Verrucomicrobiaceae bacterium]